MNEELEELRRRVNKIRLLTLHLVNEELAGEYHSSFKGQGIEFDEVRPYVPGDDVRSIDWNVTARTGVPHIKRYSEERELTVLFLVDVSGSQGCGSALRSKSEVAALVTSILALSATENGDNVGLLNFSDKIEKYIPPRRGRTAVMRLVRDVLAAGDVGSGGTDIAGALRYFNNICKRKALVFLISDFLDKDYWHEIRVAARRHDLVAVTLSDPSEDELPDAGLVEMADPETGGIVLVDTSSTTVREAFAKAAKEARLELTHSLATAGMDEVSISTSDSDDEVVRKLRKLFARRARMSN